MGIYLGIDTSNYTTSAALCDENGVICNCKKLLEVKEGERGLRQSDAVFAHVNNISGIMAEIGEKLDGRRLTAVGCSVRPRDVEGSYMPCFKVGEALANTIGNVNGIPVYSFSHQAGHIAAALYSAGRQDLMKKRFTAFHVSGGTTEILYCDGASGRLVIENVGGTLDLNAGQAIDRTGVLMGLKFPCGPALEELALKGSLPEKPCVCVKGLECNLSGLENKVIKFKEKGIEYSDIALYALSFVEKTLVKLTENLREKYDLPILYAGGVMSNKALKTALGKFSDTYFADKAFSADNGAGVALLARNEHLGC